MGRLDTTIQLWSVENGRLSTTFGAPRARVRSLAFSSDGTILASGGGPYVDLTEEGFFPWQRKDDTAIYLWRVADQQPVLALQGHRRVINSVAFSPDGRLLASGDERGAIRLWSVKR